MKELEENLKRLFLKAKSGDIEAYELFLKSCASVLRKTLSKNLGRSSAHFSLDSIEDLVQDILMVIHQKRDFYLMEKPLLPWIYTIARHRLIDFIRVGKRRPEMIPLTEEIQSLIEQDDSLLLKWDIKNEGVELLKELPEKNREILRLAKSEGVPLQEIAKTFKMSLSSVKVTIHRSLKKIRKVPKKNK